MVESGDADDDGNLAISMVMIDDNDVPMTINLMTASPR